MFLGVTLGAGGGLAARALWPGDPRLAWALAWVAEPLGQLFLRLLALVAAPLLVAALASALQSLEPRELGRLGLRILLLTAAGAALATGLGLLLFRLFLSGAGPLPAAPAPADPAGSPPLRLLLALVPPSPVQSPGGLGLLLCLAVALGVWARRPGPGGERARARTAALLRLSGRLVHGLLRAAPLGAAALLFAASARLGAEVVGRVAAYAAVVLAGLAIQLFLVYGLTVKWLGGLTPRAFFRGARLALGTAFATSSSAATLPVALQVAEEELRLPGPAARLVLTAGAAANQHGTALFEGVTLLFLAQAAGVELSALQQAGVVAIALLSGLGGAGVPGGSLPVLAALCGMLGIPASGLGLLVGIDRLLDMARTTVNVAGDLALAVVVARDVPARSGEPAVAPPRPGR
ncbi:MAG: cation:dicarboxylase symporter family transporter [Deltaproteobacteria bacterium]|nr:cation:dicarboxylase symporter family transporter [Deltaproteobacteria bacterium]